MECGGLPPLFFRAATQRIWSNLRGFLIILPVMKCLMFALLCVASTAGPQGQTRSANKTYSSSHCGFSFDYPRALTATERVLADDPEHVSQCNLSLTFTGKGWKTHHVSLQVQQKNFDQAAEHGDFKKSEQGWNFDSLSPVSAEEIHGDHWKGLSALYATQCFGGPDSTYEGMGDALTAFASSGSRTVWIDGGQCEGVDEKAFGWVTGSLRFLPAENSPPSSSTSKD